MAGQFGGDGYGYFPGQGFPGFDANPMQEDFSMAQQQPFTHRASDPLAYMQYSQLARVGRDMPVHELTKPQNNMPWSGQFRDGSQQRQHQQFNPYTWQGNLNQRGAKTEPAPNQEAYIERNSSQKHSEVSDSAYASLPTSSGPLETYNSNKNELEQDFQPYFEAFKLEPGSEALLTINPDPPQSVKSEGHYLTTHHRDSRRRQPVPRCEHCGKQPKNPSDAKKHELTHIKPHYCREPNCERSTGFATINDLERHRKSVHNLRPEVGATAGYVCQACPVPDGGGHRKFWPRKDNFKAHIRRKHPEYNEARLVEVSRQDVRPDDVRTVEEDNKSIRSAMQSSRRSQGDHNELQGHQMSPNLSRNVSDQADFTNNIFPDSAIDIQQDNFAGMGGHATDSNMTFIQYPMGPPDSSAADGLDLLGNNNSGSYGNSTMSTSSFKKPKLKHDSYSYDRNTNPVLQFHAPERSATSSTSNTQSSAASSSVQGDFKCPKCNKVKRRDCDLKKHMKRHTRPYGCTFPSCHKKFGSRNDWKRHESSQHFLHEMYKCEAKRHDGTPCVHRPFRDVEALKRHLRGDDHRLQNSDAEILDMCRQYLLGREGHERFWCGFCQRLVSQEKALQNAWDARFKHIGDHFDKEGKYGGDWVCIEENKAKRYIVPPSQEEGKGKARRNSSRKQEHEEEADLSEFDPTTEMQAGGGTGFAGMEPYNGDFEYLSVSQGRKRKHSAVDADADGESDYEIS